MSMVPVYLRGNDRKNYDVDEVLLLPARGFALVIDDTADDVLAWDINVLKTKESKQVEHLLKALGFQIILEGFSVSSNYGFALDALWREAKVRRLGPVPVELILEGGGKEVSPQGECVICGAG